MELIEFSDFSKVIFCSATILEILDFDRAKKPTYKVKLDCGSYGIKWSSAQITNYSKDELTGKQVAVCVNLKPRNIAGFISEVLITGFYQDNGNVILTSIDSKGEIENGSRLG